MKNVHYQKDGLFLHLPTLSPESLHTGLMQSIVQAVKFSMTHPDIVPEHVKEANIYLLDLLLTLIPDEQQMVQMYKY